MSAYDYQDAASIISVLLDATGKQLMLIKYIVVVIICNLCLGLSWGSIFTAGHV